MESWPSLAGVPLADLKSPGQNQDQTQNEFPYPVDLLLKNVYYLLLILVGVDYFLYLDKKLLHMTVAHLESYLPSVLNHFY